MMSLPAQVREKQQEFPVSGKTFTSIYNQLTARGRYSREQELKEEEEQGAWPKTAAGSASSSRRG